MSDVPQVTVYSAPWCVYCHAVKEYLRGKKVKFKDVDVSKDQEAAHRLVMKTGISAVPVIEIGEEAIVGFDREKIDSALREHKLV
jgi:glutaredoxin 3